MSKSKPRLSLTAVLRQHQGTDRNVMQVKITAPENKPASKACVVGVSRMSFHHPLLLAFKALMHPCQAVWAMESVFRVLEVLIQVHWHAQGVAVKSSQPCGRVGSSWCIILTVAIRCAVTQQPLYATVEGTHTRSITEHNVPCIEYHGVFRHLRSQTTASDLAAVSGNRSTALLVVMYAHSQPSHNAPGTLSMHT